MTSQFRHAAFSGAHSVAANVHAAAEQGLANFKELSDSAVAAARDRHDALMRFADNMWTSKKLVDDELAQYWTENVKSLFRAMERTAQAKSAAEIVQLQAEFARSFTAQVTNQAREIVRLSLGASEHALEALRPRSS
jgi:hypothetical protein